MVEEPPVGSVGPPKGPPKGAYATPYAGPPKRFGPAADVIWDVKAGGPPMMEEEESCVVGEALDGDNV